jgi:hypothetical protein
MGRVKLLARSFVGGPARYKTNEEVAEAVDGYLDFCDRYHELPTKAGARLWIGLDKSNWSLYKKRFDAIKKADEFIERDWSGRLSGNAATGAIFYLKNAFHDDYKDRYLQDVTVREERPLLDKLRKKK